GHFYTQSNGSGSPGRGFAVTDEGEAPIWTVYLGGGGAGTIGYPLSRRFHLDGTPNIYQVFQRQVFEWNLDLKRMRAIDIAELPAAPLDPVSWLPGQGAIPVFDTSAGDRVWDQYASAQLSALDAEP